MTSSPGDSLAEWSSKVAFADERAVRETAAAAGRRRAGQGGRRGRRTAPRVDMYGVRRQRVRRAGPAAEAAPDPPGRVRLVGRAHRADQRRAARQGDVAIGISHTGTTVEVIEALEEAAKHGATTVAVTNFPRSPLAKTADLVLTTAARETTYRSGAMASRIAQLTVIDCLFIGVAQQVLPDARKALEETASAVRGHRLKGSE